MLTLARKEDDLGEDNLEMGSQPRDAISIYKIWLMIMLTIVKAQLVVHKTMVKVGGTQVITLLW